MSLGRSQGTTETLLLTLPTAASIQVRVMDVLGREVLRLRTEARSAGQHSWTWDSRGLRSGMYVVRVEIGNVKLSGKLILLR
jgi:hypothetical protein